MMIIIINIAITIDISTNIFITNMMMIKMTKNPEDIAMEDLAIAKSSVAISSAHHDEFDCHHLLLDGEEIICPDCAKEKLMGPQAQ